MDDLTTTDAEHVIIAAGGWCAPSELIYDATVPVLDPRRWPTGLTTEDMAWLAEMLHAAELTLEPWDPMDIPAIGVRRGGIRWPIPGDI